MTIISIVMFFKSSALVNNQNFLRHVLIETLSGCQHIRFLEMNTSIAATKANETGLQSS